MTTILLPCNVQLDYKDNLLEAIVNLLDFYSLNLWRIFSGGLGWSSHTVKPLRLLTNKRKAIKNNLLARNNFYSNYQIISNITFVCYFDFETIILMTLMIMRK